MGRKDAQLGKTQRTYRRLVQLGLHEEAAALAATMNVKTALPSVAESIPEELAVDAICTIVSKPVPESETTFPGRDDAK